MATHPSAEKRHRQNLKRRMRNAARRSQVRSAIRKLEIAIGDKNKQTAEDLLKKAVATVMRARAKGVYHKNTAARKVAQLHRLIERSFSSS